MTIQHHKIADMSFNLNIKYFSKLVIKRDFYEDQLISCPLENYLQSDKTSTASASSSVFYIYKQNTR